MPLTETGKVGGDCRFGRELSWCFKPNMTKRHPCGGSKETAECPVVGLRGKM